MHFLPDAATNSRFTAFTCHVLGNCECQQAKGHMHSVLGRRYELTTSQKLENIDNSSAQSLEQTDN